MLKRVVCKLLVFIVCIEVVCCELPSEQVSAISTIYDIIQDDSIYFVWKGFSKYSNPCSWEGVGCSPQNSSITTISLSEFKISTSKFLPFLCNITTLEYVDVSWNYLISIPDGFLSGGGNMSGLKHLDFSHNILHGGMPSLNGFKMLEYLDFSGNSLSGEISHHLDGLVSLKFLNLSENEFRGRIPRKLGKLNLMEELVLYDNSLRGSIPGELAELTRLQTLDLSFNQLSGAIPGGISNITTLREFEAEYNYLNGSIPSGITSHLTFLNLMSNKLTGRIPSDLLSAPYLESLELSVNELEGPIPAINSTRLSLLSLGSNYLNGTISLGSLVTLEVLLLSNNRLTGSLPPVLGNLTNLQVLWLDSNDFVGAIPPEISQLNLLTHLNITANSLNGSIPCSISMMQNLRDLELKGNNLQGPIPDPIGNLSSLQYLWLGDNQLSGRFPVSLSQLQNLISLELQNNSLRGSIPDTIGNLSSLMELHLKNNQLSGRIPVSLSQLQNLRLLEFQSNSLSGPILNSIGNLSLLLQLNLENNRLSGPIPDSIGNLSSLTELRLGDNQLSGHIPNSIGNLSSSLEYLRLEDNHLSGPTPDSIRNFSLLVQLHLGNNQLRGRIPDVPESLQYGLNLSFNLFHGNIPITLSRLVFLEVLDLQANNLHGPIPDTIRHLSSLTQLQLGNNQLTGRIPQMPETLQIALNLSYNLFDGTIPYGLSNLWHLEVLDLSNNIFSGEVPDFLTELSYLTHLLLMNNNLSGVFPSFRNDVQVDTSGNQYLIHHIENPSPAVPHREKKLIHPDFFIAAATGFPVGLLISIIAVLISRRYHTIHGILSTPNTIHKPIIHFKKAMQAVSDPSNITLKATFSTFYKAVMPSGTTYLVKRFNHTNQIFQFPRHKELVEELEVLGELSNPNVMIPVAYLLTTRRAYLFYDFVRGTLYDILHHRMGCRLDWAGRFTIAVGVSKGLAFLHECSSGPIILLDLCSKSILLKSMDLPQISDIELCSLMHPSKTKECMAALDASSVGYVPPEYGSTKRVTAAGNVYSFGVVLLELVTGKPAVSEGSELAKWVMSISEQGNGWDEILDSSVSETSVGVRNQMVAVVKVGLACINTSPEMRPNSVTVLQMLQNRRSNNQG